MNKLQEDKIIAKQKFSDEAAVQSNPHSATFHHSMARLSRNSPIPHREAAGDDTAQASTPQRLVTSLVDEDDSLPSYHAAVHDADDERRESNISAVSVSEMSESAWYSDNDLTPIINLYNPLYRRESHRPSLSPFGQRTPRRSTKGLHTRSRTGTPKSLWSRSRRRISEATEAPADEPIQPDFPLVLLHVTLLPVDLSWSFESMRQVLSPNILDDLQKLRAKISETILTRGILVSHPQEQYELLEDRLLEALDLQPERITKCGHFRQRSSTGSIAASDSDSGVGSSIDDLESELCAICHHHVRPYGTAVDKGSKKWSIRVFAANGLMPASAWAVSWQDMESVDVEVLPWVGEDQRKKLEEMREAEEAERRLQRDAEDDRLRLIADERISLALDELAKSRCEANTRPQLTAAPQKEEGVLAVRGVPQAHQTSQIPLALLLKNYLLLLVQDWRNVAIFLVGLFVIFFTVARSTGALQGKTRHRESAMNGEIVRLAPSNASSGSLYQSIESADMIEVTTVGIGEEAVAMRKMDETLQTIDICLADIDGAVFGFGDRVEMCATEDNRGRS